MIKTDFERMPVVITLDDESVTPNQSSVVKYFDKTANRKVSIQKSLYN